MKTAFTFIISLFLMAPAGRALAMTSNPDQEVLGLIQEIDQHEVKAAEAAKQKGNIDRKVYDYAKMMDKEHSKNLDKDRKLAEKSGITPADTPEVMSQRAKGADEIARLNALEGAQFASAYIAAMVNGHTDALALIDSKASQIQNKDLKKHVSETREHVQHHLDKAKKVQEELSKP
jgi:putative membrane protein